MKKIKNIVEPVKIERYIDLEHIEWIGSEDSPAKVSVGDLHLFRYADADAYDTGYNEIFYGPIISIQLDHEDELCTFIVLCQDGDLRTFFEYEIWGETLEEYGSRLREDTGALDHFFVEQWCF
jgi:hypothetical protein